MFHALVAVKQVPDTANIRIDPETGNLIRKGVPAIINPYDAHALAAAIEWKRKLGGKVTVVSMGPQSCIATIQESIEMGADRGILISARQFSGADTLATSYVLAEVIREIHRLDPIDVVLCGKQAIDGDTAQVGPGIGVRLDWPVVTYAVKIRDINLEERKLVVERRTERWTEVIRTPLPMLMTCEKEISHIPFAPLPDLIRSLRYEPEVWTFESPVAFDAAQVGMKGSPTVVYKSGTPEQPVPGEVIKTADKGVDGAVQYAFDKAIASGIKIEMTGGAA